MFLQKYLQRQILPKKNFSNQFHENHFKNDKSWLSWKQSIDWANDLQFTLDLVMFDALSNRI